MIRNHKTRLDKLEAAGGAELSPVVQRWLGWDVADIGHDDRAGIDPDFDADEMSPEFREWIAR